MFKEGNNLFGTSSSNVDENNFKKRKKKMKKE